jgi:glucose/arabinose dehydrogenase
MPQYKIVASDLTVPWEAVFLNDGTMLATERSGNLVIFGKKTKRIPIDTTYHHGEGGLMGMALHPRFQLNRWIYLYNTIQKGNKTVNRVERYRFSQDGLTEQTIILDDIPGASYHDGGRIAFGSDDYLYITTGDAGDGGLAQDLNSLAGKILRIDDEGKIPSDNPFGNAVYSYGHRNSQGLTWDSSNQLWSTEHGPSGLIGGRDELNRIEKGQNYGWPLITGSQTSAGMKSPVIQSGITDTWAPGSALYWDGSIFFGGLRGEALYEARVDQNPVELKEHFKNRFGRIRTVLLGPDGYFYFMTSNRDGRRAPYSGDDKIIKIHPSLFR